MVVGRLGSLFPFGGDGEGNNHGGQGSTWMCLDYRPFLFLDGMIYFRAGKRTWMG